MGSVLVAAQLIFVAVSPLVASAGARAETMVEEREFVEGWIVGRHGSQLLPGLPEGGEVVDSVGLPPGLSIGTDGWLSGTPVKSGTWYLDVTVEEPQTAAATTVKYVVGVSGSDIAYVVETPSGIYSVDYRGATSLVMPAYYPGLLHGQLAISATEEIYFVRLGALWKVTDHGGTQVLLEELELTRALAIDDSGIIYVLAGDKTSPSIARVTRFDPYTNQRSQIPASGGAASIAVDSDGGIWLGSPTSPILDRISVTGTVTKVDSGLPAGVASLASGPGGDVLASSPDGALVSVSPDGISHEVWSASQWENDAGRVALIPNLGLVSALSDNVVGLDQGIPSPSGAVKIRAIAAQRDIGWYPYVAAANVTLEEGKPFTFQLRGRGEFRAAESLPTGMTLSPSGYFSGAPQNASSHVLTIHTQLNGQYATAPLNISIIPKPEIQGSPPILEMEKSFSYQFTISPGAHTRIIAGTLPAGIALDSNGRLGGTPSATTQETRYEITIRAQVTEAIFTDLNVTLTLKPQSHVITRQYTVPGFFSGGVVLPQIVCPRGFALRKEDLSPGRIVPVGVKVIELDNWVGVSASPHYSTESKYPAGTINGISTGSATNYNTASRDIWIELYCTNALR